jgi:hypothetical protein
MMHVRFTLVAADPPVLAGCTWYLKDEARPVLESERGSLGLSLLEKPGVVIFESFWATQEALWLSREAEAVFRAELARRVEQPVRAEDYQVAVFRQARLKFGLSPQTLPAGLRLSAVSRLHAGPGGFQGKYSG